MMHDISKLQTLKNLTLVNAIILSIGIVPIFGPMLMNWGGFIAVFVIAILILVKQKNLRINKVPNYFVFCGVIFTLIAIVMSIITLFQLLPLAQESGQLDGTKIVDTLLIYFVLNYGSGLIAWSLYLASMIMYWFNFAEYNKIIEKQEYETYNQYVQWQQTYKE